MRTARARRSGPTRGKDTAWFREQTAREIPDMPGADVRVKFAEREIERLRKSVLRALGSDQRITNNARATRQAFDRFTPRLAWHLIAHHDIHAEVVRKYGFTWVTVDGRQTGPWDLDRLHEQAHGRES